MDFLEIVQKRESCRDFDPRPIDVELLKSLVEAARLAPSANNRQPWNFYIISSQKPLERIRLAVSPMDRNQFAKGIPAFIVMTKTGAEPEDPPSPPHGHPYGRFDCGIAAAHIVLAAAAAGLSSCMMGWFDDGIIREVCGDSETPMLVFGIGYAASGRIREKTRRPLEDLLTVL